MIYMIFFFAGFIVSHFLRRWAYDSERMRKFWFNEYCRQYDINKILTDRLDDEGEDWKTQPS